MQIIMQGISKSFNEKVVLDNISLADNFQSMAVIGPSGAGKSTLLRIIGGLLAPTAGELYIDGKKIIYSERELQAYRRTIGFVFQSRGLFEHLTALDNVTLPLIHVLGMSREEANESAYKLLSRFGLAGEGHKYPFQLSGGQQQRLQIARAVITKPKLLLLDEPTSALDPELTAEVLDMLDELQNDGLNTIIVTHEMGFAKKACEKIIFLCDGVIRESGPGSRLLSDPRSPELRNFLNKVLEWHV